ncbi:aspartyl/asparaginyl beta-hydroxylase domain-containing protein [Streptomyces sp. NPDC052396]|uniref:aspartyl/asparaginyl beta-hydroxylase domain-containing protein n=1 Tax=Streptomyces sp. NPDC052396 TaxID=3365689 RepID=UPI0037CEB0DF
MLEPIPGALGYGMTYFSVLDPGTHIAAHTGLTNAHLRCHLCLVTPKGVRIRVGDETRKWKSGKARRNQEDPCRVHRGNAQGHDIDRGPSL